MLLIISQVDKNMIDKINDKLVQVLSKHLAHQVYKYRMRISESIGNDCDFVVAITSSKVCLLYIVIFHSQLVISEWKVDP